MDDITIKILSCLDLPFNVIELEELLTQRAQMEIYAKDTPKDGAKKIEQINGKIKKLLKLT